MPENAELVSKAFEAFFAGEPGVLSDGLARGAEWLGYPASDDAVQRRYEPMQTRARRRRRGIACRSRHEIIATLAKRKRQQILTRVVDVRDGVGDEVLMRWFGDRMQERLRVPRGVASVVVTVRDGEIVRIRDCGGHEHALELTGLKA